MTRIPSAPVALLAVAAFASLAACDQAATDNAATPTAAATPALPAFAVDTDTAVAGITGLGSPWANAKRGEPMEDARTGGRVTVLTAADGTAQVFSRPEGKVWQMRVVAGTPNNCQGSEALVAALPKVVAMAKPGMTLEPDTALALTNGMTDLKPTTRDLDGMTITTVGGCTHWLTVAVPE